MGLIVCGHVLKAFSITFLQGMCHTDLTSQIYQASALCRYNDCSDVRDWCFRAARRAAEPVVVLAP